MLQQFKYKFNLKESYITVVGAYNKEFGCIEFQVSCPIYIDDTHSDKDKIKEISTILQHNIVKFVLDGHDGDEKRIVDKHIISEVIDELVAFLDNLSNDEMRERDHLFFWDLIDYFIRSSVGDYICSKTLPTT